VWTDDFAECRAACSVEIRSFQGGSVVKGVPVLFAGIGMRDWLEPLRAEIEPWIKAQGAQEIIFEMRPGMKKFLPDCKVFKHIFRKDLV
jgi:hypothetical protein